MRTKHRILQINPRRHLYFRIPSLHPQNCTLNIIRLQTFCENIAALIRYLIRERLRPQSSQLKNVLLKSLARNKPI